VYDDPGGVAETLAEVTASPPVADVDVPEGSLAAAAARHRLWQIADPATIARLITAWEPLRLYIADGHHRYETALAYRDERHAAGATPNGPADYVLMALVEANDPGLVVLPTHRLIRNVGAIDSDALLHRVAENFVVERFAAEDPMARATSPGSQTSLAVLGLKPGAIHRLTVRPDVDLARSLSDVPPVLRELDTLILQRLILEPILGLPHDEAESGAGVQFTRDPDEALHAYAVGEAQLVFFLSPTPLDRIREAMRTGARMPQKTTYFYPKPVTGLVFFDHEAVWSYPVG
jgi:uncharacterized protein (DUF1015 family)